MYANIFEIASTFPENYKLWNTIIGLTQCNNGENVNDVQERVFDCIFELAKKHPGQTVFIGFHGMALRAFICKILNIPLNQMHEKTVWASNASITYVNYENEKFTLIEHSFDQHLSECGLRTTLKLKA